MPFGLDTPERQRAVLFGLLIMGLGYVFYAYLWKPVHEERVVLEERRDELERFNDQARALTQPRRLNELRRQEAEYQVALAAYTAMLPSGAEVADLLADVAAAAVQNNVAIVRFAPLEPVAGQDLTEVPFDLQVQGPYHDIGRFLTDIANLVRLVRPSVSVLEQVKIEEPATSEGQGTQPPRYEVLATVRLSTFVPTGEIRIQVEEEDASVSPRPGSAALAAEELDAS
jgi:type IV pilus assembly protein PilO